MEWCGTISKNVTKVDHSGGAAPINRLATELLTVILAYAAQDSSNSQEHCVPSYNREMMALLMLVCRRFYAITQGFRLQTVVLTWSPVDDAGIIVGNREDRKNRKNLLDCSPSLCQQLILTWRHDCKAVGPQWLPKLKETQKLVRRLHGIRCFQFESEAADSAPSRHRNRDEEEAYGAAWYTFGNLIQGFDQLQHLVIKRTHLDSLILACRGIRRLKTLDLIEVWEYSQDFVLQPEVCRLHMTHLDIC